MQRCIRRVAHTSVPAPCIETHALYMVVTRILRVYDLGISVAGGCK